MSITKEVKCLKCGSFIHDTQRCYVWDSRSYCESDEKFKMDCNCSKCKRRCVYCNEILYRNEICIGGHDGSRCIECNEFLIFNGNKMICRLDHSKPFCKFCNLPIGINGYSPMHLNGFCLNEHDESNPICSECNMPEGETEYHKHKHDNNKCRICNSLLNYGRCTYNCIQGGIFCIHCSFEGVVNNICMDCGKDNTGKLTKGAVK